MTAEQFKEKFPNYAYQNEDEPSHWSVVKEVLNTSFDTKNSKELNIKNINKLPQGRTN